MVTSSNAHLTVEQPPPLKAAPLVSVEAGYPLARVFSSIRRKSVNVAGQVNSQAKEPTTQPWASWGPSSLQSDALICTLLLPGKSEEEKYQSWGEQWVIGGVGSPPRQTAGFGMAQKQGLKSAVFWPGLKTQLDQVQSLVWARAEEVNGQSEVSCEGAELCSRLWCCSLSTGQVVISLISPSAELGWWCYPVSYCPWRFASEQWYCCY